MARRGNVLMICAAVLLTAMVFVASGCGTGGPRVLQSISVIPAGADAQNFPNHQVQFTALGNYSQPPSPSQITPTGWSLSDPSVAIIGQSGLAQCKSGALAVVTVKAFACCAPCSGTNCAAAQLLGTAQLSCP